MDGIIVTGSWLQQVPEVDAAGLLQRLHCGWT
jgi:hypothetical protein